ncbi:hypothetical protein ACJX0J_036266 [Zea mays]
MHFWSERKRMDFCNRYFLPLWLSGLKRQIPNLFRIPLLYNNLGIAQGRIWILESKIHHFILVEAKEKACLVYRCVRAHILNFMISMFLVFEIYAMHNRLCCAWLKTLHVAISTTHNRLTSH